MKNKGLGRGLSSLLNDHFFEERTDNNLNQVNINLIEPNPNQPRRIFDEESINELAESIKHNGLIQPIIVYKNLEDKYIIIAGERRWRACKIAGLINVPVVIKDYSNDEHLFEIAIVENIQRQNLTPIEEAESYQKLIDAFGYTQEQVSQVLGKSRSHTANILRLNLLPQFIKDKVNANLLSMGHARALIGIENPELLVEKIISQGLSVRQTENLLKTAKTNPTNNEKTTTLVKRTESVEYSPNDDDLISIQEAVSQSLGMKVSIKDSDQGGIVSIQFNNLEELDTILQKLSV